MTTIASAPHLPLNSLYPGQRSPPGHWRTWLCIGGEGAGKTHAMSAAILAEATTDPEARILVVGSSLADAQRVQLGIDGEMPRPGSLLALTPSDFTPEVRQSRRVLKFPNGARVFWASAKNPDALRGASFSLVCARALSEWRSFEALEACRHAARYQTERMRQEAQPARLFLSSRPEPTSLLKNAMHGSRDLARTRLSTYDNEPHLCPRFMANAHRLRRTLQGLRAYEGWLYFSLEEYEALVATLNP